MLFPSTHGLSEMTLSSQDKQHCIKGSYFVLVPLRKFFLQMSKKLLDLKRPLPEETSRNQQNYVRFTFLIILMNVICWCSGDPVIYRFWKDNLQQQDRSAPNSGTAHMVETTAYALLTSLSLKDVNYVNPVIKWLSEEQRYGGGFYSTQVTFLCLVLSSWNLSSPRRPPPLHGPHSFWPPCFCPPNEHTIDMNQWLESKDP